MPWNEDHTLHWIFKETNGKVFRDLLNLSMLSHFYNKAIYMVQEIGTKYLKIVLTENFILSCFHVCEKHRLMTQN